MVEFLKKHQIVLLLTGIFVLSILLFRMTRHETPEIRTRTELFSEKEYQKTKSQLTVITNKQNPREAFVLLKRQMKENPGVLASCYDLAHGIGYLAQEKYGDVDEAMGYKQDLCNAGYLHGVITSYFSGGDDLKTKILIVCNDYYLGTYTRLQCDEGIGRGIMATKLSNLSESLTLCEKLSDETSRYSCARGVFFEQARNVELVNLAKPQEVSPCSTLAIRYKALCYLSLPVSFLKQRPHTYEKALMYCENVETGYQLFCAQGVGRKLLFENSDQTDQVIRTCIMTVQSLGDSCLIGVINASIDLYGSLDPAEQVCQKFPEVKRVICEDAIAKNGPLFKS